MKTKEVTVSEIRYLDFVITQVLNEKTPMAISLIQLRNNTKEVINSSTDKINKVNVDLAMLDEEGQNFHKELPHVYDFSNIKGTQTIFDDMNYHKTFT